MRLARVPLVQIEDHVINLNLLLNAYLDNDGGYTPKFGIRYFMDSATQPEDENGAPGTFILIGTKKKSLEALALLTSSTDTLLVEEEP